MRYPRGTFLPAAAVLAALPAMLSAHPLDNASVWVFEGKAAEDKAAGKTSRPPLSMTVFTQDGVRQVTLDGEGKIGARQAATRAQGQPQTQSQTSRQAGSAWEGRAAWTVALGVRRDTLDFNIAHSSGTPNVLSELDWDMNMGEIRLNGDWQANNGFTASVELSYASAFAGKDRDSDYMEDNRQGEFSRSYAKTRGSTAGRASLGLGWRLPWKTRVGVTPMLGYAYQQQTVRMRHGVKTINIDPYTGTPGKLGSFHGLDANYSPRWHGPWMGLKFDASIGSRFEFNASARRQWFDYRSEADWNLRGDFAHPVSFVQTGNSQGWLWEIGAALRLSPQSAITLTLDRQQQRLRHGRDRLYFASGEVLDTSRLNGVNWESWSGALGYRMDF